jgi:hypothetical protein
MPSIVQQEFDARIQECFGICRRANPAPDQHLRNGWWAPKMAGQELAIGRDCLVELPMGCRWNGSVEHISPKNTWIAE